MVNPDSTFHVNISASSLKNLFKQLPRHIGALRNPKITTHFTMTFRAVHEIEGMAEETIHIPMAEALQPDARPTFIAGEDQPLRLEE